MLAQMDHILQLLSRPPLHPDTLAGSAWKAPVDSADGVVDGAYPDSPMGGLAVDERESLLACDEAGTAEASRSCYDASSAMATRPASVHVHFCPDEPKTPGQAPVDSETAGCWCFKFWGRQAASADAADSGNMFGAGRLECGCKEGGCNPQLPRLGGKAMSKVSLELEEGADIGCRL